jgi:hypothetical protein
LDAGGCQLQQHVAVLHGGLPASHAQQACSPIIKALHGFVEAGTAAPWVCLGEWSAPMAMAVAHGCIHKEGECRCLSNWWMGGTLELLRAN